MRVSSMKRAPDSEVFDPGVSPIDPAYPDGRMSEDLYRREHELDGDASGIDERARPAARASG